MSKAIEDLVNKHEAILSSLQTLESMVVSIEKTSATSTDDVKNFPGFLKEFADKCHHGKEEGLLFPAMMNAGMPEKGGPIGMMLLEHVQGRELIQDMEKAVAPQVDEHKLVSSARAYIDLPHNRIQKENILLFPMTEKVLAEDQLNILYQGFEKHEENAIGHGRHKELHALPEILKTTYPG